MKGYVMEREAAVLKALSEPVRLKLAALLAVAGETCVCRLAEALDLPGSTISRHLRILRSENLVKARREGTWMHYGPVESTGGVYPLLLSYLRNRAPDMPGMKAVFERLERSSCKSSGAARNG
jgi:ArsR family transcriptional regulator